jgi:CubicO group peptidase (beta-lactamase class C family)
MTVTRRRFLEQLGYGASGSVLLSATQPWARAATTHELPRSTPEAEGVSSSGIIAFLDGVVQNKFELHSLMILRHGRVIAEGWWTPYGPEFNHSLYSLSKSFISTAVGFAVAERKLKVDDKVTTFFPGDLPEKVSENLAALRIKDLLTMTVGHDAEPTYEAIKSQNWVKVFLAWPIPHAPGSTFVYNTLASYMLSAIVQRVTGQTALDYLQSRLFDPLGIEGATWETCPRGINTGGWGLSLTTESVAKFGQFYLQKGAWNGRQLLPSEWIEEATRIQSRLPLPPNPGLPNDQNDWLQGYGYQFWRCLHHAYRGDGAFGQFAIVMPEQDAVVVMTGETADIQGELDLVWDHLLPGMSNSALPANIEAQQQLKQKLSALSLSLPKGKGAFEQVIGKRYKLDANSLGIESVRFAMTKDRFDVTFGYGGKEETVSCGIQGWLRGETSLPGTPPRLLAGGAPKPGTKSKVAATASLDEEVAKVRWCYYETPHSDSILIHAEDDTVEITFSNTIPGDEDRRPILRGKVTPNP